MAFILRYKRLPVDASNLRTDINALFNNSDPVEVESGDSLQDVINRAEGS